MRKQREKRKTHEMRARGTQKINIVNRWCAALVQLERARKTVMELPDRARRETTIRHGGHHVQEGDIYK